MGQKCNVGRPRAQVSVSSKHQDHPRGMWGRGNRAAEMVRLNTCTGVARRRMVRIGLTSNTQDQGLHPSTHPLSAYYLSIIHPPTKPPPTYPLMDHPSNHPPTHPSSYPPIHHSITCGHHGRLGNYHCHSVGQTFEWVIVQLLRLSRVTKATGAGPLSRAGREEGHRVTKGTITNSPSPYLLGAGGSCRPQP